MKLYKEQSKILKTNSNPMLDKEKISKFKKAVGNLKIKSIIVNFEDRGVNSIFDGYCNQQELDKLSSVALKDGSFMSFRTRVISSNQAMFLMSHSMLLRGDNIRRIEFADFWVSFR